MLKKLSDKIGLTDTELKIFLFLISLLSAGIIYKNLTKESYPEPPVFDYRVKDSLFMAAGDKNSTLSPVEKPSKRVDYKQEVLDFNTQNFSNLKKTAAEKSVNLNSAGLNDLVSIPGIGAKTAEKIIEYRNLTGSFKNIDELKKIKGIGSKKFEKIKIYVYTE
jgi:comEA protein